MTQKHIGSTGGVAHDEKVVIKERDVEVASVAELVWKFNLAAVDFNTHVALAEARFTGDVEVGEDASSELALASNDSSDVGASTGLGGTNRKLNATHVDGVFGKGVGEGERS